MKKNNKNADIILKLRYFMIILVFTSCGVILEENIEDDIIEILAPADGTLLKTNTVTLWWQDIEGKVKYRIQVVQPDFENTVNLIVDTVTNENKLTLSLNTGSYEWRVRAENSAYQTNYSVRTFAIDSMSNLSSSEVIVIEPRTDFITNQDTINFRWQSLPGAIDYQLEIGQPSFSAPFTLVLNEMIINTSFRFAGEESKYSWRLTAMNENSSSRSTTGNFEIDLTPPLNPSLLNPLDGDTISSTDINFRWNSEEDAEKYIIYLMTDEELLDTVLVAEEITNQISLTDFDTITYWWNVRAQDLAGNLSSISETRKFKKQ